MEAGWAIPHHELEYVERIGEGGNAVVYRGTWRSTEVAIKACLSFFDVMLSLAYVFVSIVVDFAFVVCL